MRESLRFVLVANDICSSISERDDDDDDDNERERVLESVKRTFCRFFPFVLRKQLCCISSPLVDHKMDHKMDQKWSAMDQK